MIKLIKRLQNLYEHVSADGKETFFNCFINGRHMLVDMKKRLINAFRDAGLPTERVESTLAWLEKVVECEAHTLPGRFGGANALYLIRPESHTDL